MCTPWNKHKHKMMNFNTIYSGHIIIFQVLKSLLSTGYNQYNYNFIKNNQFTLLITHKIYNKTPVGLIKSFKLLTQWVCILQEMHCWYN